MAHTTDENVIASVIEGTNGNIGRLTLNKPQALNALDLDMIASMQTYLRNWRLDDTICAVFIDSEHAKAFCAGGDIVSIYNALHAHSNSEKVGLAAKTTAGFVAEFFAEEYRLDYCLHAYPKPIICWGHGIIMGGGMGIFQGASIKIVTEKARLAMPEINIGLFPDVGASYFLNKTPPGLGRFLGLSATNINASDSLRIGMADHALHNDLKVEFLSHLSKLTVVDHSSINEVCMTLHKNDEREFDAGVLSELMADIARIDESDSLSDIHIVLKDLVNKHPANLVVKRALASFENGSTTTAHLVLEQLKRGASKNLAQCFQMELNIACQCSASGEFQEGIRALLIDKDQQAKWNFESHDAVTPAAVDAHFTVFNDHNNPLRSLEQEFGVYHDEH